MKKEACYRKNCYTKRKKTWRNKLDLFLFVLLSIDVLESTLYFAKEKDNIIDIN